MAQTTATYKVTITWQDGYQTTTYGWLTERDAYNYGYSVAEDDFCKSFEVKQDGTYTKIG